MLMVVFWQLIIQVKFIAHLVICYIKFFFHYYFVSFFFFFFFAIIFLTEQYFSSFENILSKSNIGTFIAVSLNCLIGILNNRQNWISFVFFLFLSTFNLLLIALYIYTYIFVWFFSGNCWYGFCWRLYSDKPNQCQ